MGRAEAQHFAQVKKRNGNRLSAQNYCTHCIHRVKNERNLTYCDVKEEPITIAMKACTLLMPFVRYKEEKQNEQSND